MFDQMSPRIIALLVDHRFLEEWPFEITKRGRAFLRSAPDVNVWRKRLLGDDTE